MEIIFKKLVECTMEEVVLAWNRGFEGYFVQMEMTPEIFFQRLINEGLSMKLSLIAFDLVEPIAIILNGVRMVDGKKTVWNGGTGVATDYRGKGVSTLLMEETLKVYEQEGIEVATLEAIKENERAIRLYEKFGYKVRDALVFLSGTPEIKINNECPINSQSIRPEQLPTLPYYKENVPWQCQWQSVKSGEAQVYLDSDLNPFGYALYKKLWNQEGKLEKVLIYQFELFQGVNLENLNTILTMIMGKDSKNIHFTTINSPFANPVTEFLLEMGFKKTTEQVQMVKKL